MKFTDVLAEHRIEYRSAGQHHHARTGWIQLDCPYCSRNSNSWRLGYNLAGGYLNCWACGPKRLHETVAELLGIRAKEAGVLLEGLERDYVQQEVYRGTLDMPPNTELLACHKQYLRDRNYNPNILCKLWSLKGIGMVLKYAWRILIPIHYRGQIVSWTTRSIGDNPPIRYMAAEPHQEILNHRELLFGEDYVRNTIIIHEGPFDVFRTGPGAVCTFGTGYNQTQLTRISKYPNRVICFDSDETAQKRARKLCSDLEVFPGSTTNVILDAKDIDSASEQEIALFRNSFLE